MIPCDKSQNEAQKYTLCSSLPTMFYQMITCTELCISCK